MSKLTTPASPRNRRVQVSFEGFPLEKLWDDDNLYWLNWHTVPSNDPFEALAAMQSEAAAVRKHIPSSLFS